MKRSLLLALQLLVSSLLLGCQTDPDKSDKEVEPLVVSVEEFEAEALGVGGDCHQPLLRFTDKLAEVAQLADATALNNSYYANGLSPSFGNRQVLLVRIRKTTADERRACTTMGPGYPALTVVSARLK